MSAFSKPKTGKGDKPRPKSVSNEVFSANWDAAFGKQKPPKKDKK